VDDITFIKLDSEDVVRNRLVGDIVNAYGRHDEGKLVPPNITRSIRSGSGDR
jgi:phosphate starvation-inducible PhoH-like protein